MNNSNSTSMIPLQQSNDGVKALSKLLPIAIAIVLTNGLVFVLFYRRPRLRTSSNYPLFSLAICDFLTGFINIPYFIVFHFDVVPLTNKEFNFGLYALHAMMAVSGAYHILVITAVKYLATVRPLKHYLVTKKMVLKILLGVWIISAVFAVIPVVWNKSHPPLLWLWYIIYATVCLVAVFFVPYIFMIYAFVVMFRAITNRQRPSSVQRNTSRFQQKNNNDRKCILVFATMATIFACCWLPHFTITLARFVNLYLNRDDAGLYNVMEAFTIIRYTTSIANPVLYTFFKRDFWLALRNLPQTRESTCYQSERTWLEKGRSSSFYFHSRSRSMDSSRRLPGSEQRPSMDRDKNTTFSEQRVYTSYI